MNDNNKKYNNNIKIYNKNKIKKKNSYFIFQLLKFFKYLNLK